MQLRKRQTGITILETLLGVSISVVVLLGATRFIAQSQSDLRAKNIGEHQAQFMSAAKQYFEANRSAMMTIMDDPAGTGAENHCVIRANPADGTGGTTANSTTKKTCALDASWLKWKGFLPANFRETNSYGQRWVGIFRRIYDGATPTENADMLTVGAAESGTIQGKYDEIVTAATIVGGSGGVLPDADRATCKNVRTTSTYEACGTQGVWKVNLSDYIDSAQLTTFAAGLPN